VDFKNRCIYPLGKGKKPRTIPLSSKAYEILLARKEKYDAIKIKPLNDRASCVFREVKSVNAANFNFDIMREELGFKKTVHDIRHKFATNYLRRSGNIIALQKLLGHSNIKTTQRYEHFVAADLYPNFDEYTRYGS